MDKVKSKRRVTDLAVDCRDGLLLADVVEGVTSVKVPDLIRKPKTQQQMVSSNFIIQFRIDRAMGLVILHNFQWP